MNQQGCSEIVKEAKSLAASDRFQEALALAQEAFTLSEQEETPVKIEVLFLLGDLYHSAEKYEEAERWYNESILLIKEADGVDDPYHVYPLTKLANICKAQEDFERAEKFCYIAYNIYLESPSLIEKDQAEELLLELAKLSLSYRFDYAVAYKCYAEYEELQKSKGKTQQTDLISIWLRKAYCLLCLRMLPEAESELSQIDLQTCVPRECSQSYTLFGLLGYLKKNINAEREAYQKGLEEAEEQGSKRELLIFLAAVSAGVGEEQEAYNSIVSSDGAATTVSEPADPGADFEHLKQAGFHVAATLSEDQAAQVRGVLLQQIDRFIAEQQFLFASVLLYHLRNCSAQIRGDDMELQSRYDSIKDYMVLPLSDTAEG